MMARSLLRGSALGLASIAASFVASSTRADGPCTPRAVVWGCTDDNPYPQRMHVAVGFERLVVPVADSTFAASNFPSHTGRELGFVSPSAYLIDVRASWRLSSSDFGLVTDVLGGGAASDAAGTDPFSQQVRGGMWLMGWGFGLEGCIPIAAGVQLRADITTGFQFAIVQVSGASHNNSVGATQLFLRPRVALEIPIVTRFHFGAFLTNDVIHLRSWGVGGYLGYSF